MSLAARLARILRAQVGSRPEPENRDRGRETESPWEGASGAEAGNEPGRDPDLAGWYANLEVPYGSDLETVKAAYKRLMRRYHPDLHSADPDKQRIATELVKGLNRAHDELRRRLEKPGGSQP